MVWVYSAVVRKGGDIGHAVSFRSAVWRCCSAGPRFSLCDSVWKLGSVTVALPELCFSGCTLQRRLPSLKGLLAAF